MLVVRHLGPLGPRAGRLDRLIKRILGVLLQIRLDSPQFSNAAIAIHVGVGRCVAKAPAVAIACFKLKPTQLLSSRKVIANRVSPILAPPGSLGLPAIVAACAQSYGSQRGSGFVTLAAVRPPQRKLRHPSPTNHHRETTGR